jgi:hypothetical protein
MYAVLRIENNLPSHFKIFNDFDSAHAHADDLVMGVAGVSNEMPSWEDGEVFNGNGVTVSIIPVSI